jgi:YidC/Oxa1 family membrane protein insertase
MDRLQIAAIAVAVALVAASLWLRPSTPPPAAEPAPVGESQSSPPPAPAPATAVVPQETDVAPRVTTGEPLVTLHNDAVEMQVSTVGARVNGIDLLQYPATIDRGSGPVQLETSEHRGSMFLFLGPEPLRSLEAAPCQVTESNAHRVTLRVEREGVTVTRTVELDDAGYGGLFTVKLDNAGHETLHPKLELVFYGHDHAVTSPDHFPKYSLVASVDGAVKRTPIQGISSTGLVGSLLGRGPPTGTPYASPVDWVGVDSQYFLLAAVPQNANDASAFLGPTGVDSGQAALSLQPFDVPPGTGVERSYRLYFGPKVDAAVDAVDPRLARGIDMGYAFVRPLVTAFSALLRWTHDHVVANYGIAIILLTILVRVIAFPLTQRSMKSMRKVGELAPQMKEIQEKYANDREKMQQELMKLYSQKGANPLTPLAGGCLPMLIQMPVMFGLYYALQSSIELRHAPFAFWIRDLSAPENLFSVAGVPIRVLPLLMGGSMLLQQRLSPAPNADPQQRQMMTLMSVMFTFMFYQFPAGLVLYWFVSNLLGIAQQLLVNRGPATATAASERTA